MCVPLEPAVAPNPVFLLKPWFSLIVKYVKLMALRARFTSTFRCHGHLSDIQKVTSLELVSMKFPSASTFLEQILQFRSVTQSFTFINTYIHVLLEVVEY